MADVTGLNKSFKKDRVLLLLLSHSSLEGLTEDQLQQKDLGEVPQLPREESKHSKEHRWDQYHELAAEFKLDRSIL